MFTLGLSKHTSANALEAAALVQHYLFGLFFLTFGRLDECIK